MELEEFLEKDMIHFLEERKEKKATGNVDREEDYGLYLTKDYLKDVTRALDKDEISKAQRLFDELKSQYDTLPKTSLEAKKMYAILEQIYSKIHAYTQLKGDNTTIKSFDELIGRGFHIQAEKITLRTNNIEKKVDTMDKKLSDVGQDVKNLKSTLIEAKINSAGVAPGNQTLLLNNPKITILPPTVPSAHSASDVPALSKASPAGKTIPEQSGQPSSRETDIFIVPKSIPDKKIDYKKETVPLTHSVKPTDTTDTNLPSLTKPVEHKALHSHSTVGMHGKDVSVLKSQTQSQETKKGMHLYKIPKKTHKSAVSNHYSYENKNTEKIEDAFTKDIITKKNDVVRSEQKSVFEKTDEENMLALEKKSLPNIILNNKLPDIKIKEEKIKEKTKENNDEFDSPFQEIHHEKKIVEDTIIPSGIQMPKTPLSRSSDNKDDYAELYSEALKELNLKNYEGASRLFMKVLELKPGHKASMIRLKQCEEAMHNA